MMFHTSFYIIFNETIDNSVEFFHAVNLMLSSSIETSNLFRAEVWLDRSFKEISEVFVKRTTLFRDARVLFL